MSNPTRTTAAAVQGILVNDYNTEVDLTPYIATASNIVDTVVGNAAAQNYLFAGAVPLGGSFNSVTLELIERWLSAHCYMVMQEQYLNRRGEGAGAGFIGKFGEALEQTWYGQMALASDPSGVLWQIGTLPPKRARAYWNGSCNPTPPCGPCGS